MTTTPTRPSLDLLIDGLLRTAMSLAPKDGGWPASKDPYYALLVDAAHAWFSRYTNEFAFDQKADENGVPTMLDPIKLRFGAWAPPEGSEQQVAPGLRHRVTLKSGSPCFYIATISFDVLVTDSGPVIKRLEKGFLCLKMDPYPVLECYLQRTVESTEDADMELLWRWSIADGLEFWTTNTDGERVPMLIMDGEGATFHVPVTGASVPPAPEPAPPPGWPTGSFLAAGDYQAHLQGDRNFVCYAVDPVTGALSDPQWDIQSMLNTIATLDARVEKLERRQHRP